MQGWKAAATAAGIVLVLAGCGQDRQRLEDLSGPNRSLDPARIAEDTANQNKVLQNLAEQAGLKSLPDEGSADWSKVAEAGFNYVDQKCEDYLDSLFWWDRYRKSATNQIHLLGAATAAGLGLAEAAAKEIALVALGFGLAGETVDNVFNSVLYQLSPSGVQAIVQRSRENYRASVARSAADGKQPVATTRVGAVRLVRSYLALCLPPQIEAEVNKAVGAASYQVVVPASTNQPPVVKQASEPASVSGTLSFANTPLDRFAPAQVKACYATAGVKPDTLLVDLYYDPTLAPERYRVLQCLLR